MEQYNKWRTQKDGGNGNEGKWWKKKAYVVDWKGSRHLECGLLQDKCKGLHLRALNSLKIRLNA